MVAQPFKSTILDIQSLQQRYAKSAQVGALAQWLRTSTRGTVYADGLVGSSAPLVFAALADRVPSTFVFILQDEDEAGYFYHDLQQIKGDGEVFFFPSSFKRAVKYGQRDSANEILRTEVLTRLSTHADAAAPLLVVSYPEALAEWVVGKQQLNERRLSLKVGQAIDLTEVEHALRELGFTETDYVYEPGQFAVRGSLLDVFSFSCEDPFRVDFFGKEVDSIRTFEIQDQLSKTKCNAVEIVPELSTLEAHRVSFFKFLPENGVLVTKDFAFVSETVGKIYEEGFSKQALTEKLEGATEMEQQEIRQTFSKTQVLVPPTEFVADAAPFRRIEIGTLPKTSRNRAEGGEESFSVVAFHITPQPLFHKNFDLLVTTFDDYLRHGYMLYILADSEKQTQRLRDIFADMDSAAAKNIRFEAVNKTLHEGFTDDALKLCCFTDHQIFDRFHKYNLKSDGARAGKMALTMKELQEMEPGDFIVHVDFGIGKFGGLVRVPTGNSYQEMIRIIYQNNDKVDVSIHSLYKISKYRRADTG